MSGYRKDYINGDKLQGYLPFRDIRVPASEKLGERVLCSLEEPGRAASDRVLGFAVTVVNRLGLLSERTNPLLSSFRPLKDELERVSFFFLSR